MTVTVDTHSPIAMQWHCHWHWTVTVSAVLTVVCSLTLNIHSINQSFNHQCQCNFENNFYDFILIIGRSQNVLNFFDADKNVITFYQAMQHNSGWVLNSSLTLSAGDDNKFDGR